MSTHNPSDYESLDSEHTSYTDDDTAFEATSGAELEAADSGHNSDIEIITPDDLTDTSSAFENQPEQTQDEAPQEPQFMPVDITILEKNYTINCPVGEEGELYSASQFINSFIQDLQANAPQLPQENLLVLCCLNLYEKMQQAKLQTAANESDIAQANELLEHMIREMQLSD